MGGLLILTMDDERMLEEAAAIGKAVVLVNGDDPYMRLSSVTPCNRSAARLATEHLIAAGHRGIVFLQRPGRRTIERRRVGWRDALEHHGLAGNARLVIDVDDWLPELAAAALAELIEKEGLFFTAVLAAADVLAQGALEGLKRLGLAVPETSVRLPSTFCATACWTRPNRRDGWNSPARSSCVPPPGLLAPECPEGRRARSVVRRADHARWKRQGTAAHVSGSHPRATRGPKPTKRRTTSTL